MTLKAKTRIYLIAFVAIHIAIFAVLLGGDHLPQRLDWNSLLQPMTLSGLGLFLLVFVLDGILPASVKDTIVFWKTSNPLPGTRAFSELMEKDARIDVSVLRSRYGELPREPRDQNILWYRIYKALEDRPSVLNTHHDFLLARDLTILSAIFAALLPAPFLFVSGNVSLYGGYFLALATQYLILRIVGVVNGERFVTTVLAEESARS